MRFRKKPVIIDAIQWTGENMLEVSLFMDSDHNYRTGSTGDWSVFIPTLEGEMEAQPGDWIIREPFPTDDRKFYPCKPDIFHDTYERVKCGEHGWEDPDA